MNYGFPATETIIEHLAGYGTSILLEFFTIRITRIMEMHMMMSTRLEKLRGIQSRDSVLVEEQKLLGRSPTTKG